MSVVGVDAAHLGRRHDDHLGAVRCKELAHVRLVASGRVPRASASSNCCIAPLSEGATIAEPTSPRWPATKIRDVAVAALYS